MTDVFVLSMSFFLYTLALLTVQTCCNQTVDKSPADHIMLPILSILHWAVIDSSYELGLSSCWQIMQQHDECFMVGYYAVAWCFVMVCYLCWLLCFSILPFLGCRSSLWQCKTQKMCVGGAHDPVALYVLALTSKTSISLWPIVQSLMHKWSLSKCWKAKLLSDLFSCTVCGLTTVTRLIQASKKIAVSEQVHVTDFLIQYSPKQEVYSVVCLLYIVLRNCNAF